MNLTFVPRTLDLFEVSAAAGRLRYPARERWLMLAVNFGTIALTGFLATGGGILLSRALPGLPQSAATLALFGLGVIVYLRLILPWARLRSARLIDAMRPGLETVFTMDDEGLRWQADEIDFLLRWRGVDALFATSKGFGFLTGAIALYVPHAAFADPAAIRGFVSTALERMPEPARQRSESWQTLAPWRGAAAG